MNQEKLQKEIEALKLQLKTLKDKEAERLKNLEFAQKAIEIDNDIRNQTQMLFLDMLLEHVMNPSKQFDEHDKVLAMDIFEKI